MGTIRFFLQKSESGIERELQLYCMTLTVEDSCLLSDRRAKKSSQERDDSMAGQRGAE